MRFFSPRDFTAVMEENGDLDKLPNTGNPPSNIMVMQMQIATSKARMAT
jgi:hypothetical protein